ncbi:MAG TPA: hypothetical protein VLE02_01720 [Nitrosarchaeum sp.]|nr:hypothetical protein [Nitrosarchaeum sp.]
MSKDIWSSSLEHHLKQWTCAKSVRIITASSPGLMTDALIYHKIFPSSEIVHHKDGRFFDINIFIERFDENANENYPSKYNWLMLNLDMSTISDLSGVDLFLCKTEYCVKFLTARNIRNFVFTKHSSEDICKDLPITYHKNWGLCVHFAGKSWLKNTNELIQTWIKYKGFGLTLIVTCKDLCYSSLKTRGILLKKNGVLLKKSLSEIDKKYLLRIAGLVICPSRCEGYGHYINEARSTGSIILTTDHPSVDQFKGLKIPCIPSAKSKNVGGLLTEECDINSEDMMRCIAQYKQMSLAQKLFICKQVRVGYDDDTMFLIKTLRNVISSQLFFIQDNIQ